MLDGVLEPARLPVEVGSHPDRLGIERARTQGAPEPSLGLLGTPRVTEQLTRERDEQRRVGLLLRARAFERAQAFLARRLRHAFQTLQQPGYRVGITLEQPIETTSLLHGIGVVVREVEPRSPRQRIVLSLASEVGELASRLRTLVFRERQQHPEVMVV